MGAMMIDQQANAQLMKLQERAAEYKMVLEQQASGLKMEYAQKKSLEDMQMRQYEVQRQYYDAQRGMYQQNANPGRMMTGSYAAAPAMTSMAMPSTGSFVSAPMLPALPMAAMPAQPQSLTSGIPDPRSIEHQKQMYYKALDQQLQQAINGVMQQN